MITFIASIFFAQAVAAQASAPVPSPCTGAEFAAFDFWVGDWDVYPNGRDTLVAHSKIEKLYAGCAIRENWMPLRGAGGGSLSGYDPKTQRWQQTWIGSSPGVVQFDGGPLEGAMVLTGPWAGSGPNGEDGLVRMTYSRVDNNAVRQLGEFSEDQGKTWQPSFDFIYRPHQGD